MDYSYYGKSCDIGFNMETNVKCECVEIFTKESKIKMWKKKLNDGILQRVYFKVLNKTFSN